MRTWLDLYPTGRKHCSQCKRWRLGIDFNVRKWADEPDCTIPLWLYSICRPCLSEKNRARNGYARRALHPHGIPGSERYRQHRNARNRITRRKKARRQSEAEYKRIWRDAKRSKKREVDEE